MFDPLFICWALLIFTLIGFSILMIVFGSKKKENGKINLAMAIVGWTLLVLTIIGSTVGFILYIDKAGGFTGTVIFTFVSPLFILCGFFIMLGIGISSIAEGYKRDKDNMLDKAAIVRGWFLLSLSILLVTSIVVTLVLLFNQHSMARGDQPVRFM